MIRTLRSAFLRWKHRRYLAYLCSRGLQLGEGVSIEDGFFFDPSHCYLIKIGAHCTLAPNVRLIAHDASTKRLLGVTRLGPVVIEEGCFIGDSVIVLPGVTIGRGCIVGAGSVVKHSIPAGSVAAGNPAKVVASVEDYCRKQGERLAAGRKFSPDFWLDSAAPEQIQELVQAATRGDAFIE